MARASRRLALVVSALLAIVVMAGCAKRATQKPVETSAAMAGAYQVDYGKSKLYDHDDMDAAIQVIMGEFDTWKGCTMQDIVFTSDDVCTADVSYCNELRDEGAPEFDEAIVFKSDFHSPSGQDAEGTAWEPDTDYAGWEWHLARTGNGTWQLLTWGY